MVYEVTDENSYNDIKDKWWDVINDTCTKKYALESLANKIDDKSERVVSKVDLVTKSDNVRIFEVSAKDKY